MHLGDLETAGDSGGVVGVRQEAAPERKAEGDRSGRRPRKLVRQLHAKVLHLQPHAPASASPSDLVLQ